MCISCNAVYYCIIILMIYVIEMNNVCFRLFLTIVWKDHLGMTTILP